MADHPMVYAYLDAEWHSHRVIVGGFFADEDDSINFQEWIWRIRIPVSVVCVRQMYACPVYDWPVNRPMDTPDCDTRHGQVTLRLMQRQWPRYMFALIATFINFDEWWLESMIE